MSVADGFFPAPPALADCVRSALVTRLPGGPYLLPAALHPLLLVVLDGSIVVGVGETAQPLPVVSLCGATRGACPARAAPGTRIATVTLRPGGLSALFGVSAPEIMAACVDSAAALMAPGRGELARFVEARSTAGEVGDDVSRLWACLAAIRRGAPDAAVLRVPTALLPLPADALAIAAGNLAQAELMRGERDAAVANARQALALKLVPVSSGSASPRSAAETTSTAKGARSSAISLTLPRL